VIGVHDEHFGEAIEQRVRRPRLILFTVRPSPFFDDQRQQPQPDDFAFVGLQQQQVGPVVAELAGLQLLDPTGRRLAIPIERSDGAGQTFKISAVWKMRGEQVNENSFLTVHDELFCSDPNFSC
jgi:hypothetical protein